MSFYRKFFLTAVLVGCVFNGSHLILASSTGTSQNATNSSSDVCQQRQNHISNQRPAVGFVCAAVAIVMFGSNFVPVKKIRTGDGIFFQWILCVGIWCSGTIVHLSMTEMNFYPLAMAGGAIWCTGNICVVPIIKTIGLAMGLLIWCAVNLLSGWATGRFGIFGLICEQPVTHSALNYVGVLLALISLVIFIFVKNEGTPEERVIIDSTVNNFSEDNDGFHHSYSEINDEERSQLLGEAEQEDSSWLDHLSPGQRRILGTSMAIVSGFFYGISFVPMYIIQKRDGNAPDSGLEYVFSQFCGILMTSTVIFLIYCLYKRNKPDIYPSVVAPGFVSGIMWAIGCTCWFVANTTLSEPVSFPIVTTGPGIIASIWGIVMFKEIRGLRNFLILGLAFLFQITGTILTGISK